MCFPVGYALLFQDFLCLGHTFVGQVQAFVAMAVNCVFLFAELVQGVPVIGFPGSEEGGFIVEPAFAFFETGQVGQGKG